MAANMAGARLGKVKADIVSIEAALENYAINNSGRYPDTLVVLVTPDVNGETYLRTTKPLKDPWGNEYLYDAPSQLASAVRVYTLGRDGKVGGAGEDADVDNASIRDE
jgi:general secretion pathway protein G